MNDGAKVILCSHLGKPKNGPEAKFSLAPVAKRLSEKLNKEVVFAADDTVVGENARKAVAEMKEGDVVSVVSDTTDGTILYAEMPVKTILRVTHSEPGIKGDTATNTLKPATLETGAEVRVPLFINIGDKIKIDTRTGEYLSRV